MTTTARRVRLRRLLLLFAMLVSGGLLVMLVLGMSLVLRVFCKGVFGYIKVFMNEMRLMYSVVVCFYIVPIPIIERCSESYGWL